MVKVFQDNADPNDAWILTGDFNCNDDTIEMQTLLKEFTLAARGFGGISTYDHVFIKNSTNGKTHIRSISEVSELAPPSDHNILVCGIGIHGYSDPPEAEARLTEE